MPKVRLLKCLLILSWMTVLSTGCAGFRPIHGLPAQYVPPEIRGESREGRRTIDLSLLRQTPPTHYLVDSGDLLGVYIEGVLGKKEEVPPVHFPTDDRRMPSLGYPVPVREDGTISLPLIDPMQVRGLTIAQVEEAVRRAYTIDRNILQPGRDRILVSLQRPRTFQVLVIRQEGSGGPEVTEIVRGELNLGRAKRGTGELVALPAYQNDVLHALAETGGLPGLDAENTVYVIRGTRRDASAQERMLPRTYPVPETHPLPEQRLPQTYGPMKQPYWPNASPQDEALPPSYQSPGYSVPNLPNSGMPSGTSPNAIPQGPPRPGFMQPPPLPQSSLQKSDVRQMAGESSGRSNIMRAQFVPPTPQDAPSYAPQQQAWAHSVSPGTTGAFGSYRWQSNAYSTTNPYGVSTSGSNPPGTPYASTNESLSGSEMQTNVPSNWGHSFQTALSPEELSLGMRETTVDNPNVIRIPIRIYPGEPPTFTEEDITLYDGDIVFIESRDTEIFYTGGLLGGGQYAIPRDYDLDVLGAISIAQGGSSITTSGRSIGGTSALNQDVTISASDVVILRQLPNGTQVPIKVNLYQAMRDPEERIIIQPGDYVVLQYTPWEAAGAFVERHLIEGALFGLAAAQLNRR